MEFMWIEKQPLTQSKIQQKDWFCCSNCSSLKSWLYRLHNPLFFFMTILYCHSSWSLFLEKKSETITVILTWFRWEFFVFFWWVTARQTLLATQLVCVTPRSTSRDVWDSREENKYHKKQEEKVEKQHSDPAALYFDDCGDWWQFML